MSLPMIHADPTRRARRGRARTCPDAPPWRVAFADRRIAGPLETEAEHMDGPGERRDRNTADDLLRRALIDPESAVAVALKVEGLALADALTVVFHGRADLGTIQPYVAHGGHGAGHAIGADALLRVPCDLDLGDAESRDEAKEAYPSQARRVRDPLLAGDPVLAVGREPLEELAEGGVGVDRSVA